MWQWQYKYALSQGMTDAEARAHADNYVEVREAQKNAQTSALRKAFC